MTQISMYTIPYYNKKGNNEILLSSLQKSCISTRIRTGISPEMHTHLIQRLHYKSIYIVTLKIE
jgi:hypothetical protein